MTIFNVEYSEIYDLAHVDKSYARETGQIISYMSSKGLTLHSSILDFGCGTGKHLEQFIKLGYRNVSGYDISSDMLEIAKARNSNLSLYDDIASVPQKFDFIYSLFDVVSYQVTERSLENYFNQLQTVSAPGAWILLDGWHLPGTLLDPPTNRIRKFTYKGAEFSRSVKVLDSKDFRITNLQIDIYKPDSHVPLFSENHSMRAFDEKEMRKLLELLGGTHITFADGIDYARALTEESWRFSVLFQIGRI